MSTRKNVGSALITGASSGIGEAFARKLASLGYDLTLVARRRERLENIARELEQNHSVTIEVLVADLAKESDVSRVTDRIGEIPDLTMLVNNAGFGTTGCFSDVSIARSLEMIDVHILATTRLTHAALPGMLARRKGILINIASPSAFIPLANNTVYSATKSYLIVFSECLQLEVKAAGIQVQALCPGFTYTGFHSTDEFKNMDRGKIPGFMWMSATETVEQSLKALKSGRVVFIQGFVNHLMYGRFRGMTIRLAPKVLH